MKESVTWPNPTTSHSKLLLRSTPVTHALLRAHALYDVRNRTRVVMHNKSTAYTFTIHYAIANEYVVTAVVNEMKSRHPPCCLRLKHFIECQSLNMSAPSADVTRPSYRYTLHYREVSQTGIQPDNGQFNGNRLVDDRRWNGHRLTDMSDRT